MKGYKAFNPGWKCRDFQYEIGKTYELPEGQTLKMCECGFHFCKNPIDVFGYYPMNESVLIAKVEALGEIQQEGTKYVTDKIKIVREFTRNELQALILDGDYNSGNYNSGHHNSGDYNSGHYNSGHCNSGHCNSGDHNSGDYNSGIFNTDEPCMRAFNRETDIRHSDFINTLNYNFYTLCQRISNNSLQDEDIDRIKALPNFDAEIFKEITGISIDTERREE